VLTLRFGKDALYIGTNAGLCRLRNDRLDCFRKKDGLPSDNIAQVIEDPEGNLWAGTAAGVARITRASLERSASERTRLDVRHFARPDGLFNVQCTAPSNGPLLSRSGRIYFPTLQGLTSVDPAHRRRDEVPPVVHVESVLADGVRLPASDTVSIPRGASRIEIRYTGICTRAAQLVSFRFRLEGFEGKLVEAGRRRTAHYTAVPPGTYRFIVQARNADGASSSASLPVSVLPWYWQTGAFRAGVLVLAVALVGLGVAYRTRSLSAQARARSSSRRRTAELFAASPRGIDLRPNPSSSR
jgi:hypothetical protein